MAERAQIELRRAGALGRGRETRRWAVLTIATWLALIAVVAAGFALLEVWVVLAAVPLLPLNWWLDHRWSRSDRGWMDEIADDDWATPEEEELAHELADYSEREQDLLIFAEAIGQGEAVAGTLYPTREALMLRSALEALQTLGIALVIVAWPVRPLIALGAALWIGCGRSARHLLGGVMPERFFHTPIDGQARQRWLERERWAVVAALVPVVVFGVFKFWL